MCLAIPMKLIKLENPKKGVCEIGGVTQKVNMSFIEEPVVGEYMIVHAGFAIERLNEKDALERIEYFNLIAENRSKT